MRSPAVPSSRCRHAAAALVAAALAVAGCASKPPPPTEISGVVRASTNVNPSVSKRPSPLLVRVYQLKSPAAFNNADFVALYQRDQAELGAELLGREEMIVNPGDARPYVLAVAPETRFVGVFGAYRDLDHARWRGVVAVQPNRKQRVVIDADELAISALVTP